MIGQTIGPYQIVSPLGAGGMGEVYRARDAKLKRDVAIKVLPADVAGDRERLARFQREAEVLASLNHPHIAQVYGLEQFETRLALVMELVEGEDLSQHIARGPIPIDEALAIAKQIAEALEAAHEAGIVHRDLKPANIKVRADGTVKVLDFGLAKALVPGAGIGEPGSGDALANSPTITSPAMTMRGVILGTVAYMAPEQAKGRPVDKRADIWAFGCVLYEMVTGRRAFAGDDVSETMASVLKSEPDWTGVPAPIKPLLVRCLQKDVRKRLRDIGDATLLLEPSSAESAPAKRTSSSLVPWSVAALAAAAAIALAVVHVRETPEAAAPIAFDIHPPEGMNFGDSYIALSPDGRRIAYTLRDASGAWRLWVRHLSQRSARVLSGTEGATSPFWSPDSRSLAFALDTRLHRIDVDGGTSRLLTEAPNNLGLGSWHSNGTILVGSRLGGAIYRVADTGGPAVPVTALDRTRAEGFHSFPTFLRDGTRFIYLRNSADPRLRGVFMGSIDLAPEQQAMQMIVETRLGPGYYAPAGGPARVLFVDSNGNLMSQELDESRPALTGIPVLEAERVGSTGSYGIFSGSSAGALAYRGGEAGGGNDAIAMWVDRRGQPQPAPVLGRGAYAAIKVSPDGTRIAGALATGSIAADIWLTDLSRGISARLTSDPALDTFPIWSPDSSRLLFMSLRNSGRGLYEKRIDSVEPERLVLRNEGAIIPDGWSWDGRFVLVTERSKQNDFDVSLVQLGSAPVKTAVLTSPFNEGFGVFSPGDRYFAYVSDESGRDEVYVRAFTPPGGAAPDGAGQWRVSSDGGQSPRWRRDGRELFYRNADRVMSVPIDTARPAFTPGKPVELFSVSGSLVTQWDVAPDGERFLMPLLPTSDASEPIRMIVNWRPGGRQP